MHISYRHLPPDPNGVRDYVVTCLLEVPYHRRGKWLRSVSDFPPVKAFANAYKERDYPVDHPPEEWKDVTECYRHGDLKVILRARKDRRLYVQYPKPKSFDPLNPLRDLPWRLLLWWTIPGGGLVRIRLTRKQFQAHFEGFFHERCYLPDPDVGSGKGAARSSDVGGFTGGELATQEGP